MNPAALPPISVERTEHDREVEALIRHAFGPGRYAKAAERLREGNRPNLELSVVALEDGRVVGCSRIWPVHIGERPALLLGPFAVADAWRNKGLGAALIEACCQAAEQAGHDLVLLVGDAPYFGRLGFHPVPPGAIQMPGPVNARRVQVRELKPGSGQDLKGPVAVG